MAARLQLGWQSSYSGNTGYITNYAATTYCYTNGHPSGATTTVSNWVYHDQFGIAHPFSGGILGYSGSCTGTSITSFSPRPATIPG